MLHDMKLVVHDLFCGDDARQKSAGHKMVLS